MVIYFIAYPFSMAVNSCATFSGQSHLFCLVEGVLGKCHFLLSLFQCRAVLKLLAPEVHK